MSIEKMEDWEFIEMVREETERRLELIDCVCVSVASSRNWSQDERCAVELMAIRQSLV